MLVIAETETASVEVVMVAATEDAMEVVEAEVRGVSEDATRIGTVIGDRPEEETDAETRPEDEPLTD